MLGNVCKEYCMNSSLHGLRFIAEPERHWTERLLWIICCILSWIGSFMLIRSAYNDFQNNSLSFSADTTYLDWNTDFISIVVCEEFKPPHVAEYVKGNMKDIESRNLNKVIEAVAQIAFFRGQQNYIKRCYRGNYATGFSFDPARQCPFDNFAPIITRMYLVAKDEVPTLNTPLMQQIDIGSTPVHHTVEFMVTEVVNLPGVQNLDVEQRRCKFPDENMGLVIYKQYSFSACLVECRMSKSLEFCNCTNPLLPLSGTTSCNLDGLMCYAADKNLKTLKNEWDEDLNGIVCDCMQGCNEVQLDVIRAERESSQFSTTALVQMNHLPTIRYKRQVVREKLDLVVSMGGTAGLFLGASLLSLVEFIHYFIIRPISEIIGNHTKKKQMPNEPHVGSAHSSRLPLQVQLGKKT